MELKSLVLALGVITPLAVLSSQQTGSQTEELRRAHEARRMRQQQVNSGNNPMTIDRMNAEREQKSQSPFSEQEMPNNNNASNNQNELEHIREALTDANANQRSLLEMIATMQRQNLQMQQQYLLDRESDSRRQQAREQELLNMMAAQRLQQQKSTVATQQIPPNNNNRAQQSVRKQQPVRPVQQNNNNAASNEQTTQEMVDDAVNQANGFIDDIASNALSAGLGFLGVAHNAAQSAHQTASHLSQQADQLIDGFEELIDTEIAPIINGVGRLTFKAVETNREVNPGRNDRRAVNNSASKTTVKKTDRFKNISNR